MAGLSAREFHRLSANNAIDVRSDSDCKNKARENRDKLVVILVYDATSGRGRSARSYVQNHAKANRDVLYLLADVAACPRTPRSYGIVKLPQVVFLKNATGRDQLYNFDVKLFEQYVAKYKTDTAVLPREPYVNEVQTVADDCSDFATKLEAAGDRRLVVVDVGGDSWSVRREVRMLSLEQDLALVNPDVVFLRVDSGKCPQAVRDLKIDETKSLTIVIQLNGERLKQLVDNEGETLEQSIHECKNKITNL